MISNEFSFKTLHVKSSTNLIAL